MQSGYIKKLIQEEVKLLFERLSLFDAFKIFQKYGIEKIAGMSMGEKKAAYLSLAKKYHPKLDTDDGHAMKEINDAWDIIKDPTNGYKVKPSYHYQDTDEFSNNFYKNYYQRKKNSNDYDRTFDTEPWSWAGYSGGMPNSDTIYQNNFHDMNFVKKTAWEISGKPKPDKSNEYTFWQWDGRFSRNVLTVFAVPDTLFKISELFSIWGKEHKTKAVIVTHKSEPNIATIISVDGKRINPPKKYEHESFNQNPFNDQYFVTKLSTDFL